MKFLLNDRMAPITSEMGLLEADARIAAQAFFDWQISVQRARGGSLSRRSVSGNLEEVVRRLLPLTSVERRRFLFIPTDSPWVAYFDNGYRGTDAVSAVSYLAKQIQCRGLRIVAIPGATLSEVTHATGWYGTVILEAYGAHDTDFLNFIRSISVTKDEGKWSFHQAGVPFPFEDIERYNNRNIKERFTFDMLQDYLRELGLSPFVEKFYMPTSKNIATLIEKKGPAAESLKEYTLSEARIRF